MPTEADIVEALKSSLSITDIQPLQVGGQKAVYSCRLEGVKAAAKVVLLPDGPDFLHVFERAQREVEILAEIDSPRVVRVLTEAVEVADQAGKPMAIAWLEEFLDGADLRSKLGPLWDPRTVSRMLADIGAGLSEFHALDVVHRDLSPANIRVRDDGSFTLMDPGLARHLAKTALTGLFQPGTRGYRSPEHVPGGDVQPASDIFGLGILAFQALTGALPVEPGGTEDEYFARLRTQDVASVRLKRNDIPDPLVDIVDRCLQRQPARRYLDGGELLSDLKEIEQL
ncbi:serine/threonine-protein kinase [Actinomadura sp. 21ATH]|uniref:serine/threonine-protein kinase n=1 Tax=Actinomadura sp. 21ATH TaxID=1735444 RepID=UPI0035C0FE44